MARVINQNIPSEYIDQYGVIARPACEVHPGSGKQYSQRRYPFRLPYHARIGNINGTPNQHEVRQIFKECANCFNLQPYSGGSTPPAIGPRDRSWWYNQANGSGLWYYDYFMKQTLDSRFADTVPDWCKIGGMGDSFCRWNLPTANYSTETFIDAHGPVAVRKWGFVQGNNKGLTTLNLFCTYKWTYDFIFKGLEVVRITSDWNESTITWNNKPGIGSIIATLPHETIVWMNWISIPCGSCPYGVMLRQEDEWGMFRGTMYRFRSKESPHTTQRPFWS